MTVNNLDGVLDELTSGKPVSVAIDQSDRLHG